MVDIWNRKSIEKVQILQALGLENRCLRIVYLMLSLESERSQD